MVESLILDLYMTFPSSSHFHRPGSVLFDTTVTKWINNLGDVYPEQIREALLRINKGETRFSTFGPTVVEFLLLCRECKHSRKLSRKKWFESWVRKKYCSFVRSLAFYGLTEEEVEQEYKNYLNREGDSL